MKENKKVTIIAEACQNHQGDLGTLKNMIYAAKEAGADYIKIQSMLADELTSRKRFEEGVIENGVVKAIKRPYKAEYERLNPMDLNDEAHIWFIEECKKASIKPLSTIFSFSRIKFLASLGWDEIKVASYDCASLPFIKELKKCFRHLYISTGSTFDEEIKKTAEILKDHSFTFMHCITIYPTPLEEMQLRRINWLRQFTNSVGFSDHTLVERDGLKASFAAIFYGADVVERHFTILDRSQTKDGPISINPDELKELVEFSKLKRDEQRKYVEKSIKEFDMILGKETRELSEEELLNRDYYRGRFASKIEGRIRYNWEAE